MELTRRAFVTMTGGCVALGPGAIASRAADAERQCTLCVYGATVAGIAAAIGAARHGSNVIIVEPIGQIGGLVTSGLSWTDFRTFEALSGVFADFAHRVERDYIRTYGSNSPQVAACFRGTHGEPHVNQRVLEQMLAEHDRVHVIYHHRLEAIDTSPTADGGVRIERARFTSTRESEALTVRARMFIDATYEGDLMAEAGVAYRVGRESRDEYGESLAPAEADGRVQGYNFRYVMTDVPENRVRPEAPEGYDRKGFVGALPHLGEGGIETPIAGGHAGVFRTHLPLLPNRKADVNDTPHASIRLSMPDINDTYPDAAPEERERIVAEHRYYHHGLLYFLQNDDAVPDAVREQARQWGFCKDEFVEHDHQPPLLYIREARRMVGRYVFTQQDTATAEGDIRSRLRRESIGIGDYTHNCHGTGRTGTRFDGRHTGEFYQRTRPFQLPYGMILPERHENLLVPVACSASHVGFSAIRLEPTWAALGEAAGVAAHLAAAGSVSVQDVDVGRLQAMLHGMGAKTIYIADVEPADPGFLAVQQLGQRGAFHGLHDRQDTDPPGPTAIYGQYLRAWPGHDAALETPIDAALAGRWLNLVADESRRERLRRDPLLAADGSVTRGTFLMRLHQQLRNM